MVSFADAEPEWRIVRLAPAVMLVILSEGIESHMLAKALTVVKSKIALAVLGVALVGGGGSAVALAASSGHLSGLGLQMASSHGDSSTNGNQGKSNDRGHAEGTLTACDATGGAITVTDEAGTATTFTVNANTTFVGDIHENDSGGSTSASKPAFTLSDLCALVNKVKVQVQATTSTSGSTTTYDATKVTVEGSDTTGSSSDSSGGDSSGAGKPTDVPTPNGHSSTGGSGTSN